MNKHRVVPIEGAVNFRDLGGYTTSDGREVKWHRIFRSGQLDKVTLAGCEQLKLLNIGAVVDLRTNTEQQSYPSHPEAFSNADTLQWQRGEIPQHLQAIKEWRESVTSQDPDAVRETMKANYPIKLYSHRFAYRALLEQLIKSDRSLLFHCAAGKDRTGVAAALVLSLLGVDEQTIIEDYLITQSQLSDRLEKWVLGGATIEEHYHAFQTMVEELPFEMLKPVFDADRVYIEHLLDYINEHYGSFEDYAKNILGFSRTDIERLRERNLD